MARRTALVPQIDFLAAVDRDLQAAALAYYRGNKYMLFEAIRRCAQYQVPMPRWIRDELEPGLQRWSNGEVREFGEAFGIVRKKGENLEAIRLRKRHGWELYKFIEAELAEGRLLKQALSDAASAFPLSTGTAKSVYYEVRDVIEKLRLEAAQAKAAIPNRSKTLGRKRLKKPYTRR